LRVGHDSFIEFFAGKAAGLGNFSYASCFGYAAKGFRKATCGVICQDLVQLFCNGLFGIKVFSHLECI
jgi:hypothetical protein